MYYYKDIIDNYGLFGVFMKKKALIAAAVCLAAVIAAAVYLTLTPKTATTDFFAMDTYMNFKVTGKNADEVINEAKSETERLDREILSRQVNGSEVFVLNENHGGDLSEKLKNYLTDLLSVYEKSGGRYFYGENCCFMKAPRTMARMFREGKMGRITLEMP